MVKKYKCIFDIEVLGTSYFLSDKFGPLMAFCSKYKLEPF